jgi:hypothetical protein
MANCRRLLVRDDRSVEHDQAVCLIAIILWAVNLMLTSLVISREHGRSWTTVFPVWQNRYTLVWLGNKVDPAGRASDNNGGPWDGLDPLALDARHSCRASMSLHCHAVWDRGRSVG